MRTELSMGAASLTLNDEELAAAIGRLLKG